MSSYVNISVVITQRYVPKVCFLRLPLVKKWASTLSPTFLNATQPHLRPYREAFPQVPSNLSWGRIGTASIAETTRSPWESTLLVPKRIPQFRSGPWKMWLFLGKYFASLPYTWPSLTCPDTATQLWNRFAVGARLCVRRNSITNCRKATSLKTRHLEPNMQNETR